VAATKNLASKIEATFVAKYGKKKKKKREKTESTTCGPGYQESVTFRSCGSESNSYEKPCYGPVHLAYKPSFSACLFSWSSVSACFFGEANGPYVMASYDELITEKKNP
jgi:hypothetical protein